VLGGGIPEGYVVLVSGAPGTMKSSLTFSILYQNALQENRKCAYFTLEQGKDLILEQMASMGMADARAAEHIVTLDMGNIRKNLNFLQGRGSWLELFKMYCKNVMKADPVSVLVVDSLDVLETMAKMQDRRSELYFLFEWLRDLGPLTFLISERPLERGPGDSSPEEAYLADGILALEMHPTSDLFVHRRLRVVKMRGTKHDTGYYAFSFEDGAFEVTREFVMQRKVFGQRLSDLQNTRFKMASMCTELEVAQTYVDCCVRKHNEGQLAADAAAMAKLFTSEVEGRVVDECVQLHGGAGYMDEYEVCWRYTDARISRIYAGSSEIMREIIARSIFGR